MRCTAMRLGLFLALIGLGAVGGGGIDEAKAQDAAASWFANRQIRFITMGGPGGGYDTYMRTLIPAMERRLAAKLIPVNESGAGGLVAMTKIVNAPADGLTIGLVGGEAIATAQLYKLPGVYYDVRTLALLGRISAENKVVLVSAKSRFGSLAAMVAADKPVIWGATGKADGNADFSAVLVHATGMKSRIVLGYAGSGGINLAIENGEIDARVVSDESAVLFTRPGSLKVVSVLARARADQFPAVPTAFEEVQMPPERSKLLDWRADVAALGRLMVTTPGVPEERLGALRRALQDALGDAEVVAELKRRGLSPGFADAGQARALIERAMGALDEAGLAEMRTVVMERYY